MDDFKLDRRRWRFLDNPAGYIQRDMSGLKLVPLKRQFNTAKEILGRFADRRGVLLADDVGLGKTTVGALVAWLVALEKKRVRIYAPNEVLRRRWAEELDRHAHLLGRFGARREHIRQGSVSALKPGHIQVATHYELIRKGGHSTQRSKCDLMIIDEAHRAKGEGSAFNDALHNFGHLAKRKLILTATPFSIRLAELEQLLNFVGATGLDAVKKYADALARLHILGTGHDVEEEAARLINAAESAICNLRPYLIRHGIDDLSEAEREHFGELCDSHWEIPTTRASDEELELLLRMDRLLQLAPARKGTRRNDPRFHTGWQHVGTELERARVRANGHVDPALQQHIQVAEQSLALRSSTLHPKIAAVSHAILPLMESGEKVLLFCHHRATANELLVELEVALKTKTMRHAGPAEYVWRAAWQAALHDVVAPDDRPLLGVIIDWLASPGIRWQVSTWLGQPMDNPKELQTQLGEIRPRFAPAGAPTILDAARTMVTKLLDRQSISTRAVLRNIATRRHTFGGQRSHFPGKLDDGLRVMGAWHHDGQGVPPQTLYTGKSDIVRALFNSPFGPDVLVATDHLSEGVDLHEACRYLVHYELDPSPVRTLQRNGRIRRVGSWAALTGKPICYAYPTFGGTRDEKSVAIMRQRINVFGILLGGVPSLDEVDGESEQSFASAVLARAREQLATLNRKLTVI